MTSIAHRPVRFTLLVAISFLPLACKKAEVSYYEVPKEKSDAGALPAGHPDISQGSSTPPASMTDPAMAQMLPPVDQSADLPISWQAPASWSEGKSSSMRLGSYTLPDHPALDISITRFPGNVGGLLSNLNRWRGQIALAPISQAEVPEVLESHAVGPLDFSIAHFANPDNQQAITVALLDLDNNTWFFKMMGPQDLVNQEDASFMLLIDSVAPEDAP